jgi:hypothetical protein
MKLQHIAAALALVATGAANAAVQSGTNGDGSLFLIAFDNQNGTTTSGFFDLGYTLNSFASAAGTGSSATLGDLAAPNTTVVWNFLSNTITLNGSQVTSLGTNDWSASFTKLLANVDAAELQWVVGANDTTGFASGRRSLISGSVDASASDLLAQNTANNTNLGQITTSNSIFTPLAGKGTIDSADNGAFTFTAADGDASTKADGYVMAGNGFGNNWRNANKIGGTKYANEENGLWLVDGGTAGAEQLLGRLIFNTANGTLTYTNVTPAVPEPSTYAMALLGMGVVGLMARRRRAA